MSGTIENYTLASEYGMPAIDVETFERLGRTLLLIVAAKGSIAETEWEAFMDLGRRLGSNPNIKASIENFDYKKAKLEDHVPTGLTNGLKLMLVYEAIRVCNADGEFHEAERAAVFQAADALGVARSSVLAIEALALAEIALRAARLRLFREA